MRRSLGRPRSVLILAPHADDEAIGAYTLARRVRRSGGHVAVCVVTDGAASHPHSPSWPKTRLMRERCRETRREMRRIGIAADAVQFLRLPDGGLADRAPETARLIARVVRQAARPLLLIGPHVGDDHPDHRIVAAAIANARGPALRRWTYPVWPAGRRQPRAFRLVLGAQERLGKRRALRRYRTQAGLIRDDPTGFAMTRAQIAAFSRPAETFVDLGR